MATTPSTKPVGASSLISMPTEPSQLKQATDALHCIAHEVRIDEDPEKAIDDGQLILVESLERAPQLLPQTQISLRVRTTW